MNIQEITRYKFDGKEYNRLADIKTEIENRIGRIIDSIDNYSLNPKQKLAIHKAIITNRKELTELLNVTYCNENELQPDTKNVLDL